MIGAIYSAVEAEPAERVKEAATALNSAFAELTIQDEIRDRVLETARQSTDYGFVSLERGADADTVLEVGVPSVSLEGPTAVDPPVALIVLACVRLRAGALASARGPTRAIRQVLLDRAG